MKFGYRTLQSTMVDKRKRAFDCKLAFNKNGFYFFFRYFSSLKSLAANIQVKNNSDFNFLQVHK